MGAPNTIAPPTGFVDDYPPPQGFVEDAPAPPTGFVLDEQPVTSLEEDQSAPLPGDNPPYDQIEPGQPSFLPKRSKVVDGRLVDVPPTQQEIDAAMQYQRGDTPIVTLPKPGEKVFSAFTKGLSDVSSIATGGLTDQLPTLDAESGAGVAALERTIEGFLTPKSIGMLAGAGATAAIAPAAAPLVSGLFAGHMGKSLVQEGIPETIKAVKEHGILSPQAGAALVEAGSTGLMTMEAGAHAGARPAHLAAAAKVAEAGAPAAAEAVAQPGPVGEALVKVQQYAEPQATAISGGPLSGGGIETPPLEPSAPQVQPAAEPPAPPVAPVEDIHSAESEFLSDEQPKQEQAPVTTPQQLGTPPVPEGAPETPAPAPSPEATPQVQPVESYGERYIRKHGIEAARARVEHLDESFQDHVRDRDHNAARNVIDEASNIRKAIQEAETPTERTVTTDEIKTQDEGQKGRQEVLSPTSEPPPVVPSGAGPVTIVPLDPNLVSIPEGATGYNVKANHITATVTERPDGIYVNDIVSARPGEGDVRPVITAIRAKGKPIELTVGQRSGDTPAVRLEQFYTKLGFKPVEGRPGRMRWEPAKETKTPKLQKGQKQGDLLGGSEDLTLVEEKKVEKPAAKSEPLTIEQTIKDAVKAYGDLPTAGEKLQAQLDHEDTSAADKARLTIALRKMNAMAEDASRKAELADVEAQRSGRYELVSSVMDLGGLPTISGRGAEAGGELGRVLEATPNSRHNLMKYFRKGAKTLDHLREALAERGFDFTGTDGIYKMLSAFEESVSKGTKIFGEHFPDEERSSDPVIASARMRLGGAEAGSTSIHEIIWDAANHIYKVGMDFARWSAEMLRQLGEKVKPFLKKTWDRMQSESGGIINPKFKGIFGEMTNLKKFDAFKKSVNDLCARGQRTYLETRRIIEKTKKEIPDPVRREAIGTWIEAKGEADRTGETHQQVLDRWAGRNAVPKYQAGYEAARDLTPQEQAFAARVEAYYANKLGVAKAWGVLASGLDAYVNRIFKPRSGKAAAALTGGRIKPTATFQKHRFYETAFDAEQPKIDPTTGATIPGMEHETKDIGERMAIYAMELNKVIAHRKLIADLSKTTAPDGMPAVIPTGTMRTIKDASGDPQAQLVFPDTKLNAVNQLTGDPQSTHGYRPIKNNWLLKDWKWIGTGEDGAPVLMQSDLAVHPDLWSHINNITRGSALRDWQHSESQSHAEALFKLGIRAVEAAQALGKEAMFSLSGFHYATIGEHVLEHRINPFGEAAKSLLNVVASPIKPLHEMITRSLNMGPVDYNDPKVAVWMQHGLMLAPDHASARQFMEGVGGTSGIAALTKKINDAARKSKLALPVRPLTEAAALFGRAAQVISDDLFMRYIPALKLRMADTILKRNLSLYANKIASGAVKTADVRYLTALQVNAAASHLNLVDIGRNPTFQHVLGLAVLAPDFTESRGRFAGQAAKGFVSKTGHEQLLALAIGAGISVATIRVINQLIDDDPHWEAKNLFSVISGKRRYEVRSVQGDILKLLTDKNQFAQGRLSPLAKAGWQEFGGTNYRGEKMTQGDIWGELLGTYIPISVLEIPGLRELQDTSRNSPVSPLEQFAGTMGIHTSRYSPITETYQLAKSWKKSVNIPTDNAVYPVSKYTQLRYALEDGDSARAREAYLKLNSELTTAKIAAGFKESVNHPFTGRLEDDLRFERALSGADKQIYRRAIKSRKDILLRFELLPK